MRRCLAALLIISAVLSAACLQEEKTREIKKFTQEESREIAESWIKNSPTYKFDGESIEFVNSSSLPCDYCWAFEFRFISRHGGYGDRTGQIITQVITPHIAKIAVQEGKVVEAMLDNKWDEVAQKMIEANEETEEPITHGLPQGSAQVVRLAVEALSKKLGVAEKEIDVKSVEAAEWRDASLGCPEQGKMYAQVITPGFRIILSAGGKDYEYHSSYSNIKRCSSS